jgi:hypothetical protein
VRNCPRLGDDSIEFKQGQADGHELVSILWFCGPHQRSWQEEPSLVLEASRVVVVVRRIEE